jgi:hypothetical protein
VSIAQVLYVVVCGAAPAPDVGKVVMAAHGSGWDVHPVATPAGRDLLDLAALEAQTGRPVRSAVQPTLTVASAPGQSRTFG